MGFRNGLAPVRRVEDDLPLLPRIFGQRGYRTAIVSSHPWFDATARLLDHFDERWIVPPVDSFPYAPLEALSEPVYRFLDARARDGRSFFLYVHGMDTHAPYRHHPGVARFTATDGRPKVYDGYDSSILYTDAWFGRLTRHLRASGLLERTIVVFTSDHGEEFQEMGGGFWNNSHGHTVRRAQLHVPLVVRLPGGAGPRRWPGMTRHVDLAPTLLGLAGAPTEGLALDGQDLAPQLLAARAGTDDLPATAFSWRYWGVHRGDEESVLDQWTGLAQRHRVAVDRFNYPASRPQGPPVAGEASELSRLRRRKVRELLAVAPDYSKLGDVVIGVPTLVVDDGGTTPTFEAGADDGRWRLEGPLLITCGVGESPPALSLGTPWAPGRYRVAVRLAAFGDHGPVANRFRLELRGNPSVEVDGAAADAGGWYPLGVQEVDDLLVVRYSAPRGGVAVTGFRLAVLDQAAEEIPLDDDLDERLRALGYLR
jgi:hypothetical protein